MKPSDKPHIKAKIKAFKNLQEKADKEGLQVPPSVNGPYILDPKTGSISQIQTMEETIQLKAGKKYVTRNGVVTPPLEISKNGTNYKFSAKIQEPEYDDLSVRDWLENGKFLTLGVDHRLDIIAEA